MKCVCIVCEGQTEETFVRDVLAPAFYDLGLSLIPEMVETSPGHKGGALKYERVKRIPLHTSHRLAKLPGVAGALDKDGYLLQAQP